MQRQEIPVRFSELRQLATTVPPYLAHFVGVDAEVSLQTAIEDDLRITDLDVEMLLVEFGRKYQVDLSDFDFTGFITYDGWAPYPGIFLLLRLTFYVVMLLPAWLVKVAVAALCWPFDARWALAIWKTNLLKILFPLKQPLPSEVLTLGDFVASAAAGYFVKRERVRFVLV